MSSRKCAFRTNYSLHRSSLENYFAIISYFKTHPLSVFQSHFCLFGLIFSIVGMCQLFLRKTTDKPLWIAMGAVLFFFFFTVVIMLKAKVGGSVM